MKKVLTIAGSDCSGGAGIQADIKTITAHKMYAMSVITALTAQNTTGVYAVLEADREFIQKQLDCIFKDIYPDSVKIGMVSNSTIIEAIAGKLTEYSAKNIVLDPVMVSTSGSRLLNEDAIKTLTEKLMPLATVITPNIMEAECLCEIAIENKEDMTKAAKIIRQSYIGHILIKGGHLPDCADDLLYTNKNDTYWFKSEKIANPNTHGTGCTLSSAIACNLTKGFNIVKSIQNAKDYITGALSAGLNLGKGRGPLNHCYNININIP